MVETVCRESGCLSDARMAVSNRDTADGTVEPMAGGRSHAVRGHSARALNEQRRTLPCFGIPQTSSFPEGVPRIEYSATPFRVRSVALGVSIEQHVAGLQRVRQWRDDGTLVAPR
jgi:hypothetical protein